MNESIKGARGILTILATWSMMFLDTFAANITGLSPEAMKAAFIATLPITVKLIYTDLRPKIMEWMK